MGHIEKEVALSLIGFLSFRQGRHKPSIVLGPLLFYFRYVSYSYIDFDAFRILSAKSKLTLISSSLSIDDYVIFYGNLIPRFLKVIHERIKLYSFQESSPVFGSNNFFCVFFYIFIICFVFTSPFWTRAIREKEHFLDSCPYIDHNKKNKVFCNSGQYSIDSLFVFIFSERLPIESIYSHPDYKGNKQNGNIYHVPHYKRDSLFLGGNEIA